MPELPEVETTMRGLQLRLEGRRIESAVVRNRALRRPIPRGLEARLAGSRVQRLSRRAKYLLIENDAGALIVHLGMSGRLWIVDQSVAPQKHDHFDLVMENGAVMRLRDPRRFGLVLWQNGDPLSHPLLRDIGPEPFSEGFNAEWMYEATRGRSGAIKNALLDSKLVAGVGNIYASEALFAAGIHPATPARRISLARYEVLAKTVRDTLKRAIAAGGSSLRDYVNSDGQAGNFQNRFAVYGRQGQPCVRCGAPLRSAVHGQRSTYYCARCQT